MGHELSTMEIILAMCTILGGLSAVSSIHQKAPNKSKHSDLVKLSPFLFQKSRQLHQTGV
jgi:hypothetical protein